MQRREPSQESGSASGSATWKAAGTFAWLRSAGGVMKGVFEPKERCSPSRRFAGPPHRTCVRAALVAVPHSVVPLSGGVVGPAPCSKGRMDFSVGTADPSCRAMSAETMKMPEPIIEPATSIVVSSRPRLRVSSRGADDVSALLMASAPRAPAGNAGLFACRKQVNGQAHRQPGPESLPRHRRQLAHQVKTAANRRQRYPGNQRGRNGRPRPGVHPPYDQQADGHQRKSEQSPDVRQLHQLIDVRKPRAQRDEHPRHCGPAPKRCSQDMKERNDDPAHVRHATTNSGETSMISRRMEFFARTRYMCSPGPLPGGNSKPPIAQHPIFSP